MVSLTKSAGSFLGGITNNPGSIAILLGLGALILFRKDIRETFSGISKSFGNIGKVDIKLPDISFPSIPQFVPNIFGKVDPTVTTPIPSVITGKIFDPRMGEVPLEAAEVRAVIPELIGLPDRGFIETGPEPIGAKSVQDLLNRIARRDAAIAPEEQVEPRMDEMAAMVNIPSQIQGQQFFGGGPSFIGGTVFETPITGESSLGFIIDKLGVSASRAASIRAEARGFSPEEEAFLNQPGTIGGMEGQIFGNAPGFEGLTPEEISLRLTGGVISNF